jgi:hypothetical protein
MISYFPIVTGSLTVAGDVNITGAITASGGIAISGSIDSASYAQTATSASYAAVATSATTASFANNFTVTGNLTAQTLVVQTITSSVDFVTGSTRFGTILGNTHVFSGSVSMNPGGLFVSSNGVVGIGTTNPLGLLMVSTSATTTSEVSAFTVGSRTNGEMLFSVGVNNSSLYTYIQSTRYNTNYANISLQPNGGSVGIGTTGPSKTLEVSADNSSTTSTTGLKITNWNATTNARAGIVFQNYDNNGAAIWSDRTGSTSGVLVFGTNGATGIAETNIIERMRITSGGNVGIGTSSPSEILQANGNIRALQTTNEGISQIIADASNTTAYRVGLATFGNTASGTLIGIGRAANSFLYKIGGTLVVGTESAYPLIFSTTDTERMRLTSGGNLLIGTTSDIGVKVNINGAIRTGGYNTLNGSTVAAHATPTTLFSLSGLGPGAYLVFAHVPAGAGDANNYTAYATVLFDAIAARIIANNGGITFLTLSGVNVQGQQNSGNPQAIDWAYLRIR